jgi:lipoate-protein ligase A
MTAPLFEELDLILDDTPHDAAWNMAFDEALTQCTRLAVLRFYRWSAPSVSFGYFGRYREVTARWPDRVPVRRWTGGGEVTHGGDITYTLVVPPNVSFATCSIRDSYSTIHRAIAQLLPGAVLAESDSPNSPTCFARPVVADVLHDQKKIAGAAQRRGDFGLLHQGSIQTTHAIHLPPGFPEKFAGSLSREIHRREISDEQRGRAEQLAREKYGTLEWLKRR